MRQLVKLRTVKAVNPIPDADAIEVVTIDGWKVVTKKGDFKVGDPCVYFEIDCFLRDGVPAWQFLVDKSSRMFEGERGHVLRTVKLRGQISQGLILKISDFPIIEFVLQEEVTNDEFEQMLVTYGSDIASIVVNLRYGLHEHEAQLSPEDLHWQELLGVKKWEPEIPAELAGLVKGLFPSFIPKTDEERCQNLEREIFELNVGARYEVSTKLDGTSCTIYFNNGELGVCSRNLELKLCEENAHNTLVRALYDNLLNVSLTAIGRNVAVQGEVMGPGIQKNREMLRQAQFFIFKVYDIDAGRYMTPAERHQFVEQLRTWWPQLEHVPVMYEDVSLEELGIDSVDGLLALAEGPSLNNMVREGLVFKRTDGLFSFKAISQSYLVRAKD